VVHKHHPQFISSIATSSRRFAARRPTLQTYLPFGNATGKWSDSAGFTRLRKDMQITFEQASVCPHCVKKGISTQTIYRYSTATGYHSHCGSCGWLLPESISLTVPEELVHIVRELLELQHMRIESPLCHDSPWDTRQKGRASSVVRLTKNGGAAIQLIWSKVGNDGLHLRDTHYYLANAKPASTWKEYADSAPKGVSSLLNLFIEADFTTRFMAPSKNLWANVRHCEFNKLIGGRLFVQAEVSW
jgi:hypothetical protein